ncbi:MAG: hypothetical protein V7K48_13195 [Nostoc sp.]|uniref:hypothetical protein n=1 Tax=Nostoc sp. TaxID=1180 RepID=UPI002FFC878C
MATAVSAASRREERASVGASPVGCGETPENYELRSSLQDALRSKIPIGVRSGV